MPRKWTSEEYVLMLVLYFSGKGIESLAVALDRTPRAVEDVLLDDMPRNYRDVISHIGKIVDRTGEKWKSHERDYVRTLQIKGRTLSEISKVTGRSIEDIEDHLRQTRPTRPDTGFGL